MIKYLAVISLSLCQGKAFYNIRNFCPGTVRTVAQTRRGRVECLILSHCTFALVQYVSTLRERERERDDGCEIDKMRMRLQIRDMITAIRRKEEKENTQKEKESQMTSKISNEKSVFFFCVSLVCLTFPLAFLLRPQAGSGSPPWFPVPYPR